MLILEQRNDYTQSPDAYEIERSRFFRRESHENPADHRRKLAGHSVCLCVRTVHAAIDQRRRKGTNDTTADDLSISGSSRSDTSRDKRCQADRPVAASNGRDEHGSLFAVSRAPVVLIGSVASDDAA